MLQIGKINRLQVVDELPFGFYLSDDSEQRVLLPHSSIKGKVSLGDSVEVFLYHDSDDRLIATMKTPLAMLEDVAVLRVKSISRVGAFLDWGLEKDLLVPFSEQEKPMQEGLAYVVYVFQDPHSHRLAASTKLRHYLHEDGEGLCPRQAVELIIYGRSDLGYKAVIDETYLGLIFKDEVFQPLRIGQRCQGFVKRIREDGKIDLCFQFHDPKSRNDLEQKILDDLVAHGGLSTLTDKSPPEQISQRFGVSKNTYKKALGSLFKQKRILLDKTKITLIETPE